jgi:hypothetical protein
MDKTETKALPKSKPQIVVLELVELKVRDNAPLLVCKPNDAVKKSKIRVKLPNGVTYVGVVDTHEERDDKNVAFTFGDTLKPAPK